MSAAAILAEAQNRNGTVRLAIGTGRVHRWSVAVLSPTMVTLERFHPNGTRAERATLRLAEIETRTA